MVRAFRNGILLLAVPAVALLPLYGDPKPSSIVSHAEWARMLLRGLDLIVETPGINDTAEQVFATLSGRDSRAFPADAYVKATRIERAAEGGTARVQPVGGIGEAVYALAVARGGDYRFRFRLSGPSAAEAELSKSGEETIFQRFTLPAAPVPGWIDAGVAHLEPGAYDTTVLLPEGGSLEYVEIAPPCVHPIEPEGGWRSSAVATTEDVAVTVLQALDLESELPPAGAPIERRGAELQLEEGALAGTGDFFRASPRGARVLFMAELPESGLYTLSVLGVAPAGQRWTTDGCRSSVICPSADPTRRWRTILSGRFERGPHVFAAALGPDTLVERLRLEPKKATAADYAGTTARLGLELGPSGPVTREQAEEARRFLGRRRSELLNDLCGDILRPGTLVAELAATGPGAADESGSRPGEGGQPSGGVTTPGTAPGGGPGAPPIVPPLPPPSPTLPVGFEGD